MDTFNVYKDIQARTKGEIYVGVVGPVRTGKSTFIRRFMETLAIPSMTDQQNIEEVKDQLPLSGSGKLITTVEPKFIPKEALEVALSEDIKAKLRLIDCVGYLVPEATGNMENEKERMVKTPWFDKEIPFHQAAEYGTRKVIQEHATIGIVVTCDGSFGEIGRDNFIESEERTILELQSQKKPFVVVVNSQKPHSQEASDIVEGIKSKYNVNAISVNCEQLKKDDIVHILEMILYEFPVSQVEFYIPKWIEMLPPDHYLKADLLERIRSIMSGIDTLRNVNKEQLDIDSEYVKDSHLDLVDLASGTVKVRIEMEDSMYYQILSELTGVEIKSEYDLIHTVKDMAAKKSEYEKVEKAIASVRGCGYGVVLPEKDEIKLEEPSEIKHGNKYGVRIKSQSPSIHMIRANIETEIAPIVGSEEQAKDLISYIKVNGQTDDGLWQTNIFGKTIEQLVEEGIQSKISQIGEESQVKLQDTMQKIVNDSKGGMVCIIL